MNVKYLSRGNCGRCVNDLKHVPACPFQSRLLVRILDGSVVWSAENRLLPSHLISTGYPYIIEVLPSSKPH